jgi:hypothetical protein
VCVGISHTETQCFTVVRCNNKYFKAIATSRLFPHSVVRHITCTGIEVIIRNCSHITSFPAKAFREYISTYAGLIYHPLFITLV